MKTLIIFYNIAIEYQDISLPWVIKIFLILGLPQKGEKNRTIPLKHHFYHGYRGTWLHTEKLTAKNNNFNINNKHM